jgi:hypothetical protein
VPGSVSKLRLSIFDGTRQPFAARAKFLVRIVDGNQKQLHTDFHSENTIDFDLPFHDNFGDNHSVVVSCDGCQQAGYQPVKLSSSHLTTLDIMLVPNDPGFSFVNARWPAASAAFPFLVANTPGPAAQARYETLLENNEKVLAGFLNICEAMSKIQLAQGTPLDYIKQVRWDTPFAPAQDRFFAWCDPALIDQVKTAAAQKRFAAEDGPGLFHPGATSSWKQVQFGEANVQLTFHEGETTVIDGAKCVMVEPDIDYFRDLGAHAIFEVATNSLTHSLTNPVEVYVLRWIAGRTAGIPEFAPLYTVV